MVKPLSAETWSYNWQFERLTSFGDVMPNNYDGEFRTFWAKQVHTEMEQIVDLACGNGALTWIFNEILNPISASTQITGVDFASISPFKSLRTQEEDYPAIKFVGDCALENLSLSESSFDLAASQYGIEYSNLEESIPEVARVLKPHGKMSFVLHDRDGVVVTGATTHIDDYVEILSGTNIEELILELEKMFSAKNFDSRQVSGTAEYESLMGRFEKERSPFAELAQASDKVQTDVDVYEETQSSLYGRSDPPGRAGVRLACNGRRCA
jgi:ubiquinone/menaquinone biosynthesis C-methylase UbiE